MINEGHVRSLRIRFGKKRRVLLARASLLILFAKKLNNIKQRQIDLNLLRVQPVTESFLVVPATELLAGLTPAEIPQRGICEVPQSNRDGR